MLVIGGSGSQKTNPLLNSMSHQPDTDNIYLYDEDQFAAKSQLLINKCKSVDLNHCNDPKLF